MKKHLISINDLPPEGKNFDLSDQDVWLEPLREFKMECRISQPLDMKVFIMPVENGCLVRGELLGAVTMPCNRCTEDARITIDSRFDEFEEIPQGENPAAPQRASSEGHVVFDRNSPMLDLGEVAWEQFMLALPSSPLCKNDCKGLCPQCGVNLNLEPCACNFDDYDDRMAPLRGLTIKKQ